MKWSMINEIKGVDGVVVFTNDDRRVFEMSAMSYDFAWELSNLLNLAKSDMEYELRCWKEAPEEGREEAEEDYIRAEVKYMGTVIASWVYTTFREADVSVTMHNSYPGFAIQLPIDASSLYNAWTESPNAPEGLRFDEFWETLRSIDYID